MKKILFCTYLLFSISVIGQNRSKKIDSIKQLLKQDINNTKYINWLCVLYQTKNVDSAVFYGKSSVVINKDKKELLPHSYTNLGVSWWYKGNLDSAKYCFEKAISINTPIKDSLLWAKNNCNIAILEDDKGNYEKAIKGYENGLLYFQQAKDTTEMYKTHVNIALLYEKIKEYSLSLKHNKIALLLITTLKNKEYLSQVHKNMGVSYINIKKYKKAKHHLIKGLEIAKKNQNNLMEASLLSSLGVYYTKKEMYKNAIKAFVNSIILSKKVNYSDTESESLIYLSYAYSKDKQHLKAKTTLQKIDIDKIYNYERYLMYLNIKSEVLFNNGNYKDAYLFKEKYQTKQDSVKTANFSKNLLSFQTQYQTQQKENKILKQQNELQQNELALQKGKQKTNLALAGLTILVLGGGLYFRKRKRDEKIRLLNQTIKTSEEEKTRIGRDLHDGVASNLLRLIQETELNNIDFSHKLLASYNEIRGLSHQLNNTPMHGEIFADRVFELIPKNTKNKKFALQITPRYLELQEPIGTHLYRIIQELIANDNKHSNATNVTIYINENNNTLFVNYKDNGSFSNDLKKGKGFKNIEDRIQLVNGKFQLNTTSGLNITIEIPLKK